MKKLAFLLLPLLLAACEQPVDPAKIKILFSPPTQIVPSPDRILIENTSGDLLAEPGQTLTLQFNIYNKVRDDIFLKFDDSTAYVASIVVHIPGELNGRIVPGSAPAVNPAASAGAYKHLLASRTSFDAGPDRMLNILLPVELPKVDWDHIEISVVFSIRGYTRETRGEFRDTITRTYSVTRKNPSTLPVTTRPANGLFLRPATNPATLPRR